MNVPLSRYDGAINNSESSRLFPERGSSIWNTIKEALNPSNPHPTTGSESVVKIAVIFMGMLLIGYFQSGVDTSSIDLGKWTPIFHTKSTLIIDTKYENLRFNFLTLSQKLVITPGAVFSILYSP